jgi:tight adherence protein C
MLVIGFLFVIAAAVVVTMSVGTKPSPARANLFIDLVDEQPKQRTSLLPVVGRLVPKGLTKGVDAKLMQAGHPYGLDVPQFLGVKVCLSLVLALLGVLVSQPLLVLVGLFIGFVLPDIWLTARRDRRQEKMARSVADIVDQLTICVEAGLGFDAALRRVATTNNNPLAGELSHTVSDIQAGVPREQALRALSERVEIPEVRQVVLALVQAQKHGVPIAETLRIQASEMRVRRRQGIEEKAAKLPIKIMFPTMVFILPAFFIIVLGPSMLSLVHNLTHLRG